MNNKKLFNRLKNEKSLYLKQHATNPVDWWPYSPEAIQKAQDENKPIFLSIGYSSCHWCHVMARESFENETIANLLNDNFICIKVDKEEHPDIDHFYQIAAHLFMKKSGWPLSIFLLPNMKPYFAGTYFPPTPIGDTAGLEQVLTELSDIFNNNRKQAEENANKVYDLIMQGATSEDKIQYEGHFPHPMAILNAIKDYQDNDHGGYGTEPKFPNYPFYEWAIEQMLEGMIDKEAGSHILMTIEKILMGSIYDHLRGGIHRYSTDIAWNKPHFEKMLYDQSGLLRLLAKTGLIYPSPLVYDTLYQTLDYLEKEMMNEGEFLFSAQSAESEKIEGFYYSFTEEEFENALNNSLSKSKENLKKWMNISKEGNFHSGLNTISLNEKYKEKIFSKEGWELIREAKKCLLNERKQRIPPTTDTKGIASWNFNLMTSLLDIIQYCPIDAINEHAKNLLNTLKNNYERIFTEEDDTLIKIHHTTSKESNYPLLEDYIYFAELKIRLYEIFGMDNDKDMFLKLMTEINNQFVKDNHIYTRPLSANNFEEYPNQRVSSFDNSFRSSAITFIHLTRKAALLSKNIELLTGIGPIIENLTQETLLNPLNSGEALRVLTYPSESHKLVIIPRKWTTNSEFRKFTTYFMPRFTFDFHDDDNNEWQICSIESCEIKGSGLSEFKNALTPEK